MKQDRLTYPTERLVGLANDRTQVRVVLEPWPERTWPMTASRC